MGTVREVVEDDPSSRFADLLDTVEGVVPDGSDSDEKKSSRAENIYVAMDDKVGWVSRKRRNVMPDERPTSADRVTALEKALTGFADRHSETVVTPSVGLTFDSINEAYEFYKLYSWETGFGVRYAKSIPNAPTFRHSALYITALEVANMGDRNSVAFEFMMSGLVELRTRGAEVCAFTDGLGVVEQQVSNNAVAVGPKLNTISSVRSVEGNRTKSRDATSVSVHPPMSQASKASCPNGDGYNSDFSEAASRLMTNVEEDLLAPERNKKRGRPTTSHDKAPYEKDSAKRSRFCSVCRGKGHKSSTCPDRGDVPKKERKVATCGKCGVPGHRRTTCSKPLMLTMAGVPPSH